MFTLVLSNDNIPGQSQLVLLMRIWKLLLDINTDMGKINSIIVISYDIVV